MKKYKQSEWLDIYNAAKDEGHTYIEGINLGKDLTITSLNTATRYSGTLTGYGSMFAGHIRCIPGENKQFVQESDGSISLVVDSDEKVKSILRHLDDMKDPRVIPVDKWVKDYITHRNSGIFGKSEEDLYDKIELLGFRMRACSRVCYLLNADVTFKKCYGSFGRVTTEHQIEIERDILGGMYFLNRGLFDGWNPGCTEPTYHAYFDEQMNIVFDNDGKFDNLGVTERAQASGHIGILPETLEHPKDYNKEEKHDQ